MKTVQLAIRDSQHAHSLWNLLVCDGAHQVHIVERPNLAIQGVIVMDLEHLKRCGALAGGEERLVVMASKAKADLARLWKAGVQHVVFRGDSPQTVRVAVLAAELSLTEGLRHGPPLVVGK